MNKKIYTILGIVIICLGIFSTCEYNRAKRLANDLSISKNNEKAYMLERDSIANNNREFKLTIDQLNYSKDSIIAKLNQSRRELNIKDKNIKSLEYLVSGSNKIDTVVFRDTLFREPELKIDTILGDKWYKLNLGLEYPNKIVVNPKFASEKHVITYYTKEYVNPPKKWWIQRIFQKKHKVVEIKIIEKSPYINNKESKFIEILK